MLSLLTRWFKTRRPITSGPRRRTTLRLEALEERALMTVALHPATVIAPPAPGPQSAVIQPANHSMSPAITVAKPISYKVGQVYSFQDSVSAWAAGDSKDVKGLSVQIGSNQSAITVNVPNTWWGSLSGNLTAVQGYPGDFYFSATKTLNTGVGLNAVSMEGVVALNASGQPVALGITVAAGNSLSAVVDNAQFGSSASDVYTAIVTLQ